MINVVCILNEYQTGIVFCIFRSKSPKVFSYVDHHGTNLVRIARRIGHLIVSWRIWCLVWRLLVAWRIRRLIVGIVFWRIVSIARLGGWNYLRLTTIVGGWRISWLGLWRIGWRRIVLISTTRGLEIREGDTPFLFCFMI